MEKDVEDKIRKLNKCEDDLNKLTENYEEILIDAQISCPHEKVVEGDYFPCSYSSTLPPFRVCTVCGYAEEGWGCGYSFLDNYKELEKTDRPNALAYLKGRIIPNSEHSEVKFGRKELRDVLKSKKL
jgi:hypothetical protein